MEDRNSRRRCGIPRRRGHARINGGTVGRIRKLAYWLTIPCGRRGGYAAAAPSLDDGAIKEAWFRRVCEVNADDTHYATHHAEAEDDDCARLAKLQQKARDLEAQLPCERDQVNVSTFEAGGDDVYIPGSCLTHWWTGGCDSG